MDGMTGLNPEQAKETISKFEDEMATFRQMLIRDAFEFLENELSKKWYSPKAVEYGKELNKKVFYLNYDIKHYTQLIGKNAIASYNILAAANGISGIDNYFNESNLINGVHGNVYNPHNKNIFMEESPSGDVGMNVTLVKNVLQLFMDNVDKALRQLDNVPLNIAFYDPNEELKHRFNKLIVSLRNETIELASSARDNVMHDMEQESDNIRIAKQEATEALTTNA